MLDKRTWFMDGMGSREAEGHSLRIHFVGVGGCGMYAAASMMLHQGARVTGSDLKAFPGIERLQSAGATIHVGHSAGQVPADVDLVVISAAIPDYNPEVWQARQMRKPVLTYPELLGEIMKLRRGIAVAGTHGKSTTTALTAYILQKAGLDPSYIFGGTAQQLDSGSHLGSGPDFVVEACEFARSFLHLRPRRAAILNVDRDHLDCFHDIDAIVEAFCDFAALVAPDGTLVLNHEDSAAERLTASARCAVETFGLDPGATWRAINRRVDRGCWSFEVAYRGESLFQSRLRLAGLYNVGNALAATALAYHAGADPTAVAEALESFQGVYRRMTWRGRPRGVNVVDDYAHHPRAITYTLDAIRQFYQPRRTWVVFQPHQHSRTRLLMNEFAASFDQADVVIIPDIYEARDSASERAMTGSKDLVAVIHARGQDARYQPSFLEITKELEANTQDGDLIVTMGAGDIWKVADELVGRA